MRTDGLGVVGINMPKTPKDSIPGSLLDLFWLLAEGSEKVRTKASNDIVSVLQDLQGKKQTPCEGLKYAIKRLVKGLASDRKWARLGYSLALTQVLRIFSQISLEEVFKITSQELQISNKDAKSDRTSLFLGKIMVYIAIVRSSRLYEVDQDMIGEVMKNLFEIHQQKKPLHLIATQTLVEIINGVSKGDFESKVWPLLKEPLSKGWAKCEPDHLMLLIASLQYKEVIGEEFLSEHWGGTPLINAENVDHIANVMMASTFDHPVLHGACTALTELAGKKSETTKLFWNDIVVGKLLNGNLHQKCICLKLVPVALKHTTSAELVPVIFGKPMLNLMWRSFDKDAVLRGTAKQLSEDLVEFVGQCEDAEIQSTIIMSFLSLPCSYKFDIISRTKTVTNMLHKLNLGALSKFVVVLKSVVLGQDNLSNHEKLEERHVEAKKNWAAYMLTSALSNKNVQSDLFISVLRFMFLHSFFQLNKIEKTLPECDQVAESLSDGVRRSLQKGFFKSLTKLSTVRTDKSKKPNIYIDTLYEMVQYSRKLLQSESTKQLTQGDNIKELLDEILMKVEKMRKEETNVDRENQSVAFQLLFLQLSIQLFQDSNQAETALRDLTVCYGKASLKNRRASMKRNVEEPDWVEVVVELLLSLLSMDSRLNRVIATKVFTYLRPHLTPGAINLVMQVFRSGAGGDNQLDFEDEEEEEDMDDEVAEEGHANDENGQGDEDGEDEDSEDESSEEEDEDNMEVNEELRKAVKEALGKAAVNSDEEEDVDDDMEMDDESMLKLDDALSAAFKGMSSKNTKKIEKEKTLEVKNFRMRCLDLVTTLVTEQTPPSMILMLCKPLLELLDSATRDKEGKQEEKRLHNVLVKLTKLKNLPPDPELKVVELPSMIQDLITYSMKVSGIPMVVNVAYTCLFVIKFIFKSERMETKSPVKTRAMLASKPTKSDSETQTPQDHLIEILENSLSDFCLKRETRLSHMLFHTMCQRQSELLWPLTEKLLDLTLSDEIRVFCKTQTASMLSVMINKNTARHLGEDRWSKFASNLVKSVTEHLLKENEAEKKPHYMYELLLLMHRTISTSKENILDLVPDTFVDFVLKVHESQNKNKDLLTVCSHVHSRICAHKGICNKLKGLKKRKTDAKKTEDLPQDDNKSPEGAKKRKLSESVKDANEEEVTKKVQKKKKKNRSRVKKASMQIHSAGLESALEA